MSQLPEQKLESPDAPQDAGLSVGAIARLTASLILAEQAELIAQGQMPREAQAILRDPALTASGRDALMIDEEGLGFDSLSRLGLVLRFNRFFGLSATGIEDYLLVRRRFGDWVALIAEHQRLVGTRLELTFDTSGSSGPVKHLTHPYTRLRAEVEAHLQGPLAHVASPGRILAMVPAHHIYGCIMTCILSDRTGREVVDISHLSPTAVFRHAQPGDLVVGTPFTWDLVGRCGQNLPPDVSGLTSAGPTTAATFALVQGCNLARMTEIYGATETGGIATRTAFEAPFTLLPHLQHVGGDILWGDRPLPLQDRLSWQNETQFTLLGRKDDVVQVAGVNVSPAHLRARLLTVEGVAEAAVRRDGPRLRALIVPATGQEEPALSERLARVLSRLPAPARPAQITFAKALPRNAMGKLCDWDDGKTRQAVT